MSVGVSVSDLAMASAPRSAAHHFSDQDVMSATGHATSDDSAVYLTEVLKSGAVKGAFLKETSDQAARERYVQEWARKQAVQTQTRTKGAMSRLDQWKSCRNFSQRQPTSDNKESGSSDSPKSVSSSELDPPPLTLPNEAEEPQASCSNTLSTWVRRTGPTWQVTKSFGHNHGVVRNGLCTEESGLGSGSSSDTESGWPYATLRKSLDQLDMVGTRGEGNSRSTLIQAHAKKWQDSPPRPGPAPMFRMLPQIHRQMPAQHKKSPGDPRRWDLEDVQSWLKHEARKHNISIDLNRFHMNGKGLVFIGLQGFQRRMPQSGHIFHRDLRRMLRAQQLGLRR